MTSGILFTLLLGGALSQTALSELEAFNVDTETSFRHDLHCLPERAAINRSLRNGGGLGMTRERLLASLPKPGRPTPPVREMVYIDPLRANYVLYSVWRQVRGWGFYSFVLAVEFKCDDNRKVQSAKSWTIIRDSHHCYHDCSEKYRLIRALKTLLKAHGTTDKDYRKCIEQQYFYSYPLSEPGSFNNWVFCILWPATVVLVAYLSCQSGVAALLAICIFIAVRQVLAHKRFR